MLYYLSLGTNLDVERKAVAMTAALARDFGPLLLFPFVHTAPQEMDSEHDFLNGLAVVSSDLPPDGFKARLNRIETELGRDRSDPLRSVKDRPADIDIVWHSRDYDPQCFLHCDESYVHAVLAQHRPANLRPYGLETPERPTAIDFDGVAGHVRVFQDGAKGLIHRFKTRLKGQ